MTVWEIVQQELEKNEIECYPPGIKEDECKKRYVVLKQTGSTQAGYYSSETVHFDFMLYVPRNKYHLLDEFEKDVKEILSKQPIYPMLMPEGTSDPDFYDDEVKAHMRSFLYRNTRKVKHL